MTLSRPGHNLSKADSANISSHKAKAMLKDGPEGYSEDGSITESEDDNIKAPNNDHMTGNSGADRGTIADSPRMEQRRITLKPSRFGSPFAYQSYQNKQDFFKWRLAQSTDLLFYQVVAEASIFKELLSQKLALTDNHPKGLFCGLKDYDLLNIGSDCSEESDRNETRLQIYDFGPGEEILRLPSGNVVDPFNTGGTVDVHRNRRSETGEVQYFVVNEGLNHLRINGIAVEPAATAGPLPEFSVFELAQSSFFWWHTAAGLEYMPSVKRKRRAEDSDGEASKKTFKGDSGSPKDNDGEASKKDFKGDSGGPENNNGEEPEKVIRDDTESSPDLQVFPDSKSWQQEYRRRIDLCEKRPIKYTSFITDLRPPHQFSAGEMHDIDVILAIGAVWLGLIEANVDFAYANSDLFSIARSKRMVGMHAVKGTNHFLMPLLFHREMQALSPEPEEDKIKPYVPAFSAFQRGEEEKHQEDFAAAENAKQNDPANKNRPPASLEDQEVQNKSHKGGIGHFMLVIAEKVTRASRDAIIKDFIAKESLVRLRIMDSAPAEVDKGLIRRVARNTVRNAGWLGDNWPRFHVSEEYWVDVLGQTGNRCGEHTVLNAWAYMLEIPLATTREQALGYKSYNEVRKMIRLALRGQLDSLTIRAWMQHSKYAVDEPLRQLQQTQARYPDSPNNLRNMQTVALNEDAFNEIVNEMYTQEQAANQAIATEWSAISITPDGATHVTTNGRSTPHLQQAAEVTTESTSPLSRSRQDPVTDLSSNHNTSPISTVPAKELSMTHASYPISDKWLSRWFLRVQVNQVAKNRHSSTSKSARKAPSIIPDYSKMADYDVVLGISPIWEGLKRLRRADVNFTYAGTDMFSPGGEQQFVGAVGGWSRFIMPLFFSPVASEALENQGKGREYRSVGHLLLCVAELVNDQPMTVQFEIFDSCPKVISMREIQLQAEGIVETSDWLNTNGSKPPIVFRPCISRPVPRQVGYNTCGLHTILNAWAYMLGIPIHPGPDHRGRTGNYAENRDRDNLFLRRGLEMVNLALAGFMDSETIQAFFNRFGYSVEQRLGDPARAVIPFNTIGMNQEKLRRTLKKRQADDKLAAARARANSFDAADMQYLMDQSMSNEQAWRALVLGEGTVEGAMKWHFGQEPFGEMPRPEDALSPKTPESLGHQ